MTQEFLIKLLFQVHFNAQTVLDYGWLELNKFTHTRQKGQPGLLSKPFVNNFFLRNLEVKNG